MDAVGIVEALNIKFEDMKCKKGVHFILHKMVICNSTIKAYKEYDYTLWYIADGKKYQVTRIVHKARVVTEKEENDVIKFMEKSLLSSVFNLFLDHNNLILMLDGKFKGYTV